MIYISKDKIDWLYSFGLSGLFQGSSNCLIRRTSMALKGKGHPPTSCDLIRRDETIFWSAPRPENPKLEIFSTWKRGKGEKKEKKKEMDGSQISPRITCDLLTMCHFPRASVVKLHFSTASRDELNHFSDGRGGIKLGNIRRSDSCRGVTTLYPPL